MAFASTFLMFAGSPQTFVGFASAQDSLFLFFDVLSIYGRYVWQRLTPIFVSRVKFFKQTTRKEATVLAAFATPTRRPVYGASWAHLAQNFIYSGRFRWSPS
jgi:hypothetical protein